MEEVKKKKTKKRYVRVRKEGGSTVLTLGKAVPDSWNIVSLSVLEATAESVTIQLKKES